MLIGRSDVEAETPLLWPPDVENCLKPLPVFIIIIFILHSINGVAESTLTLLTA